jgi:hypothetical protein
MPPRMSEVASRRGFAILETGKVRISGFLAWLVWAGVHLEFLAQSYLRTSVLLQWVWTYVTGRRGSRLIVDPHGAGSTNAAPERAAFGDDRRPARGAG